MNIKYSREISIKEPWIRRKKKYRHPLGESKIKVEQEVKRKTPSL